MASSNPIRSPVEPPSNAPARVFCGLRLYAERDGDHVTGRVEFPYETYARTQCPIDYRSHRPSHQPPASSLTPTRSERRAEQRRQLAERYLELCRAQPDVAKQTHAKRVADMQIPRAACPRSIQMWAERLETQGAGALADNYVAPPKRIAEFDPRAAFDGVLICAWWAFRIGNIETIDTPAMTIAVDVLASGYPVADVLAAIDCYYAWPCNRCRYPFRAFAKWFRYDLDKWLIRAAEDADYRRAVQDSRNDRAPLQPANPQSAIRNPPGATGGLPAGAVPDPRTRTRDTRNHPTQQAIQSLAPPGATGGLPTSAVPTSPGATGGLPASAAPSSPGATGGLPASAVPTSILRERSHTLAAMGAKHAARMDMASTAPGITPIAAKAPTTMAETTARLDEIYRGVLLRLGGRDRDPATREAISEATATRRLWWAQVPHAIAGTIDLRVGAWCAEHGIDPDHPKASRRRVLMLRPYLRPDRSGIRSIAAAMRLPV